MPDDEKVQGLEAELEKLKRKLADKEDDDAIKERQDYYRLSMVDSQIISQEIHGNLLGLNADNHTQYLNNARHDVTARHTLGTVVPHTKFLNLTDTPGNYTSAANKRVKVNSGANGLVYDDLAHIEHQAIDVSARALGANRPTEASVGTVYGWKVAKTKEFFISERMNTLATGDGPDGAANIALHIHAICDNTSADKQLKFILHYVCAGNAGTVLGGAGSAIPVTVDVPTTANENFEVSFQIPKAEFSDKPYLLARLERDSVVDDPDPDDDPIIYKVCLLYDVYK